MNYEFDFGEPVRVIRTIRNDGTFPGLDRGERLVTAGSVGHVRDVGTFLQDQIVYTVDFLDSGRRVGCREEELVGADEPWTPTRFEFRQKVATLRHLEVGGERLAPAGTVGEVVRVLRNSEGGPRYHVAFNGRTLLLREALLEEAPAADERGAVAPAVTAHG